jgi:hypothetical protein
MNEDPSIVILRSRKVVLRKGSSMTHSSLPQLLSAVLKAFQVASLFLLGGTQMPKISSMYLL